MSAKFESSDLSLSPRRDDDDLDDEPLDEDLDEDDDDDLDDDDVESLAPRILRRVAHAEIEGEPREHHTLEAAFALASGDLDNDGEAYVIGNERLYRKALSQAYRIYLAIINARLNGDQVFPEYHEFSVEEERRVVTGCKPGLTFLTLVRPHNI